MKRLLLLGFTGSLLLCVGGLGIGAVPRDGDPIAAALGLSHLHTTYDGRIVATALAIGGLALLLAAWWALGRHLADLVPGAVTRAAALWSLPLLLSPPLFSRDVYAYLAQGDLVATGLDAYEVGPGVLSGPLEREVDEIWAHAVSPYGPVFLWLAGLVVRLTGEQLWTGVLGLRLLACAGLALVAWGLPRLARAYGGSPGRALWLGLANPLVLMHGVGGAHNEALMLGLMVAGLAVVAGAPSSTRLVAGAVLVTLAALVKVPAALALPYLVLHPPADALAQRARTALIALPAAAVTAAVVTAATGLGWGWVRALGSDPDTTPLSLLSPATGLGVGLGNTLESLGVAADATQTLDVVLALGVVAGALLAVLLLLWVHHLGALRALGLSLLAIVVLGPIVQPWYLLWGLVVLAAVAGRRTAATLGVVCLVVSLAVLPNGRSVVRPPFYGLTLITAAGLGLLYFRRTTDDGVAVAEGVDDARRERRVTP
ncbi:MAG TPA: polyprenol phosphomannose-dependent alpha 1,6 mannosyltransferase MptB [Mycobacteriales bacterium]|nr:polyprenol phosphomannose-dependent alpha 1,6 mannosyltransferase MptB [Mycobacteriales bacterium]